MGLKAAAHRSKMNRHSKNPTGYFGNPTEPRKPDTDIENDTGGETDHDTVTVNGFLKGKKEQGMQLSVESLHRVSSKKRGEVLYFNFKLFSMLVESAYINVEVKYSQYGNFSLYPLEDVLEVFRYYFQRYEDTFRAVHPNIRLSQIESIIMRMSDTCGSTHEIDLDPDDYPALIDKHFRTQYRCDYNVNHFFSGDIRAMRYYEEFY